MYQQVQNEENVHKIDPETAKLRSVATPDVEAAYLHVDWIWATLPYIIILLHGGIFFFFSFSLLSLIGIC